MRLPFILVTVALCLAASVAMAWTPEYCVTPGNDSAASPCLATGPDNTMHAVYVAAYGQEPSLYYRKWQGTYWSAAQQLPGYGYKTAGPSMCIDSAGHIHVVAIFRPDGDTAPYTVYYWEYNGVSWSGPTMLSDGLGGESDNCGYCRIAVDRFGSLHVIWSEGNRTGNKADLIYRRCVGGVWQPRVNLTNNGAPGGYGSCNPDMALDAGGDTIHVVWHDGFSGLDLLYYTKSTDLGSTWLPSSQWVQLSGPYYGKGASIVLDRYNRPSVWWTDSQDAGLTQKYQAYRRWNGSSWTPIAPVADWADKPFMCAAFDSNNLMHFCYRGGIELYYRTYDFTSFSSAQLLSTGDLTYKADDAAIVIDPSNYPSVLWEERKGAFPGDSYAFFTTAAPLPAPDPVKTFAAIPSDAVNRLSWTNPPSINFTGTLVRCKTTGYPTSPSDGTFVCDRFSGINAADAFTHSGLTNNVTYYYAAWAHDAFGHYSTPVLQTSIPLGKTLPQVKQLADGTPIDLYSKIITGVFPDGGYLYVEESDRTSGIRVATAGSGLAVGDKVNVSGIVRTVQLSGRNSERQISSPVVTKVSSGHAIAPVAMQCRAVGGGAVPPYLPGVQDGQGNLGVGQNNIGSLVRISGRVTYKVSNVFYVDDGSRIVDTASYKLGVMVTCPDSSLPVAINNIVCVTGVVEGSIPTTTGWTTNRRTIHIRTYADIRKIQ